MAEMIKTHMRFLAHSIDGGSSKYNLSLVLEG